MIENIKITRRDWELLKEQAEANLKGSLIAIHQFTILKNFAQSKIDECLEEEERNTKEVISEIENELQAGE